MRSAKSVQIQQEIPGNRSELSVQVRPAIVLNGLHKFPAISDQKTAIQICFFPTESLRIITNFNRKGRQVQRKVTLRISLRSLCELFVFFAVKLIKLTAGKYTETSIVTAFESC